MTFVNVNQNVIFWSEGKGNGSEWNRVARETAGYYSAILSYYILHFSYYHIIITGQVNIAGSLQGPVTFNNGLEIHNELE